MKQFMKQILAYKPSEEIEDGKKNKKKPSEWNQDGIENTYWIRTKSRCHIKSKV